MAHGPIWRPRRMLKRAQRPRLMYQKPRIKQWRAHIPCRERLLFPPPNYPAHNRGGNMIKTVISIFLGFLFIFAAQSAQIVNIDYIHTAIADKWDVVIPYNREITNVGVAANMKYLLTAIDVANEILNGEKTTDYGNGEFATTLAADTIATDTAVETLVKKAEEKYKFFITTTPDTDSFGFEISATGEFLVDWGDGTTEKKTSDSAIYRVVFDHVYSAAGTYTIKIGGQATAYEYIPASSEVYFRSKKNISSLDGSLGAILPTMSDGSQPGFYATFQGASNLTSIPGTLFSGIYGPARDSMFLATFEDCSNLETIPEGLFSGISGPPAHQMFWRTFQRCEKLSAIPENLFGNISGAAANRMFEATFKYCTNLTGPSARINGKYLYEIWSSPSYLDGPYCRASGLSDYATMPSQWKYCD